MASIQGLPPLPKSLSGILNLLTRQDSPSNSTNYTNQPPSTLAITKETVSDERWLQAVAVQEPYYANGVQLRNNTAINASRSSPYNSHSGTPNSASFQQEILKMSMNSKRFSPNAGSPAPSIKVIAVQPKLKMNQQSTGLDLQLANLRDEMVGLRELDMSLLYQLLSLHDSIQEVKHIASERPPSRDDKERKQIDWEGDTSADDTDDYYGIPIRKPNPYLHPVVETFSHNLSPSSSESSLEYGNI